MTGTAAPPLRGSRRRCHVPHNASRLWYNVKKRRREESSVEWLVVIGISVFLLYFLLRSAVKGGVLDAWTEIERRKQMKRGDE